MIVLVTRKQQQDDYLAHHGIKGQKWGVRRFQNEDGTRTPAGKKRYGENEFSVRNKQKQAIKKAFSNHSTDNLQVNQFGDIDDKITIGDKEVGVHLRLEGSTGEQASSKIKIAQEFLSNLYNDKQIRDSIAKEYFDNADPWINEESNTKITRQDFTKKMQLDDIEIDPDYGMYQAFYYDGGTYLGHYFVVEGSLKDGKVRRTSLEG